MPDKCSHPYIFDDGDRPDVPKGTTLLHTVVPGMRLYKCLSCGKAVYLLDVEAPKFCAHCGVSYA